MLSFSKISSIVLSPLGSSLTPTTITSVSLTVNFSALSASIAVSLSETINLKIPYLELSAMERALILTPACDIALTAFFNFPSLFSRNTESCFTLILSLSY